MTPMIGRWAALALEPMKMKKMRRLLKIFALTEGEDESNWVIIYPHFNAPVAGLQVVTGQSSFKHHCTTVVPLKCY